MVIVIVDIVSHGLANSFLDGVRSELTHGAPVGGQVTVVGMREHHVGRHRLAWATVAMLASWGGSQKHSGSWPQKGGGGEGKERSCPRC